MINSSLFFSRQCKSLDWSDCLVVFLLSATHFWKSGHAHLIRGCFSFSQCFSAGVFSSLSPPPPHSLWLAPSPPLFGKFQHGTFASKLRAQRKSLHCRLEVEQMNNWRKYFWMDTVEWMNSWRKKKYSKIMIINFLSRCSQSARQPKKITILS